MSKTKPIKEKKEKQEKTTKPVRLPRSVQQLIPVKRVFRIQSGRSETTSSVRHGRFPILTMP